MTTSTEIDLPPALPGIELAKQILNRLFLNFDGSLHICLWDGSVVDLGLEFSKNLNRKAISFHYDASNDFYELWLDEQMLYSCAYYEDVGQSLEQAQRNKLDHICRKLRLKSGEHLLDPGGLFLNHGITSDEGGWKKASRLNSSTAMCFPMASSKPSARCSRSWKIPGWKSMTSKVSGNTMRERCASG